MKIHEKYAKGADKIVNIKITTIIYMEWLARISIYLKMLYK